MTEIISDLATELADSYETQAASSTISSQDISSLLPSAAQIYRTGRVLYHYHLDDRDHDTNLIDGFDQVLSTLPNTYLTSILLHDINYAYAELIFAYASSTHYSSTMVSSIGSLLPLRSHTNKLSSSPYTWDEILEGTESICGIYLSRVACSALGSVSLLKSDDVEEDQGGGAKLLELVVLSLAWVYDCLSSESNGDDGADMKKCILDSLSMLLRIGLVNGTTIRDDDDDEKLTNIMNFLQNIQASSGEYNCALGDMLDKEQNENDSLVKTLCSTFTSKDSSKQLPPQLQYLLSMLRSSPRSSDDLKPSAVLSATTAGLEIESIAQPLQKKQNMVDIQIDHIKSILSTLGEGYIEEALKCYNHDVGRTLEALIQLTEESGSGGAIYNNIHPRLCTLPKNLPRQLKKSVDHYTANVDLHRGATVKEDGREHVQRQKELIRDVERKAEEEALLMENVSRALGGLKAIGTVQENDDFDNDDYFQSNGNEYDDDYDDQYDGIGNDGGVGVDEGLYDVDTNNIDQKYDRVGAKNEQEMWRKYNRMIKDVQAEGAFWEDNRNLNRASGYNKGPLPSAEENTGDDEQKKYRSADKGKKGRLIGPDGKYLPIIKRGGKQANPGGNPGRDGDNTGRGSVKPGRGAGKPQGGSAKGEGGDDMSKIQKRRKNDSKAKIGNHHRKDRATKKAAGGMI